ncbi:AP-1 complex subunit sigma-2 [Penaeus vannamei]|uniref:AP-1 complex subunit sigma-2 n=1 Tax=Penaeus vannamei TaxID=6689 RepID=A0A3R7SPJ6_PENVA|nr:AP-1 complex subunit sigma-2 [Penaeus vannamei]
MPSYASPSPDLEGETKSQHPKQAFRTSERAAFLILRRLCADEPAIVLTSGALDGLQGLEIKMQFMLLFSRQGKLRLQKWYEAHPDKVKKKITRELISTILARKPKMSSFLEWKDLKIVYKRYASLYFCCAIEQEDNELLTLEIIHRYVELLDKYFGSVCELDIIFNFEKAYFMLDELMVGGEVCETSKKNVLKAIAAQDLLQEVSYGETAYEL